jgi:hypothetical protein
MYSRASRSVISLRRRRWYERLFGRAPDLLPNETEAASGRGLAPRGVQAVGDAGRKATFVDPDGNRIVLATPSG